VLTTFDFFVRKLHLKNATSYKQACDLPSTTWMDLPALILWDMEVVAQATAEA